MLDIKEMENSISNNLIPNGASQSNSQIPFTHVDVRPSENVCSFTV
jgi:hypothetical protein